MQTRLIQLELNGKSCSCSVGVTKTLAGLLRDDFGLSTSIACGEGNCGTCTVLVDGHPVRSCLMLAVQASGRTVTSLEGLGDKLLRLQSAFADNHAIQCGFCAPGVMVASSVLLRSGCQPCEAEIREAIKGHLCRCTGYSGFVSAILGCYPETVEKQL
jgi:aerobic-type carbon monoxide dehydrogenase small subunit (CoxS/CutS family)